MKLVLALTALLILTVTAEGRVRCTDSKSGKYVSHSYAKKYPGLTQCTGRSRKVNLAVAQTGEVTRSGDPRSELGADVH